VTSIEYPPLNISEGLMFAVIEKASIMSEQFWGKKTNTAYTIFYKEQESD